MDEQEIARMKKLPVDFLIHEIEFRDYLIEDWKKEVENYKWLVDVLMRLLAKEWNVDLNTLIIP